MLKAMLIESECARFVANYQKDLRTDEHYTASLHIEDCDFQEPIFLDGCTVEDEGLVWYRARQNNNPVWLPAHCFLLME